MKRFEILVPRYAYKLVVQACTISDAVRYAALSFADCANVTTEGRGSRRARVQRYHGGFLVITESGRRFHAHGRAHINLDTTDEESVAYRYHAGCPLCEQLVMQGRRKGIEPLRYTDVSLPRLR